MWSAAHIAVQTDALTINQGGYLSADTFGSAQAASVNVVTHSLDISDPFSQISANTETVAGGNAIVTASGAINLNNGGGILANTDSGGNAGTVSVHAASLNIGLASIASQGNTNTVVYYHTDGLGSITKLTSSVGSVLEQYSYDVYGKATIKNASGTVISATAYGNRFLFTGREYIAPLNLYNYRVRLYSAQLGRFLQPDPIGHSGDLYNIYRYCNNSPANYVDPFGLDYTIVIKTLGSGASSATSITQVSTGPGWTDVMNYTSQGGDWSESENFTSDNSGIGDGPSGVSGQSWSYQDISGVGNDISDGVGDGGDGDGSDGGGGGGDPGGGSNAGAPSGNDGSGDSNGSDGSAGGFAGGGGGGGEGAVGKAGPSSLRAPDFANVNITIAIPTPWTGTLIGYSISASADRYGGWYWSLLGVSVGKSVTAVSVSLTANYMNQLSMPSAQQLSNFLTASGFNVGGGFYGGAGETFNSSGSATGFGIYTPQLGGSYNYSFQGPSDDGISW